MQPLVNMVAKLMLMNKPSWMFGQELPADQGNVSNHWILKTVQELNFLRKPNQIFKDSLCSADDVPFFPIPYHHHQHIYFQYIPDSQNLPGWNLAHSWTRKFMFTNILFPFWNCDSQFKHLAKRVNLNLPKCFLAVNNYFLNNPS